MYRNLATAVTIASLTALPAIAESDDTSNIIENPGTASEWQYSITPFIWFVGIGGSASIGPVSVDIGSGSGGLPGGGLDSLEAGAMFDFGARNGQWAFRGNLVFGDFSGSSTGSISGIDRSIGLKTLLVEVDAEYYFQEQLFGYFGARYYDVTTSLAIGPPVSASASKTITWLDPIIGAGFAAPISDKWSVSGKADIGGFGLGSDFSWQAQAYVRYQPTDYLSILAGYRYLSFDYRPNSITNLDLAISGPVLGLQFNF